MIEDIRCMACKGDLSKKDETPYCYTCEKYFRVILVEVQSPIDKILKVIVSGNKPKSNGVDK